MRRFFRHGTLAVLLVGLAALVAGCGAGTTTPNSQMTQDAADDIAINAVAALVAVGGDVQIAATVGTGGAASPNGATHVRRPGWARMERAAWDTTFTQDGITYTASATFYDAFDNQLPYWGPLAVRLLWVSDASGVWTSPRDSATVDHHAEYVVHGIHASQETLTFSGSSYDTLSNRFISYDGTRTRYFHWASSLFISSVKWGKGAPYPASGTLTFSVSADRTRSFGGGGSETHWDGTVLVTFNGTAEPVIVVNGRWTYKWNMATGAITRL